MSDTVKLIIEIPKHLYDVIKNKECTSKNVITTAVENGTPLDDVMTEMEKHQFSREYCCDHNIDTAIDMGMVRIILGNIGKEESEE